MPRPVFHATMPRPAAGGGPIAIILRVLMLGVALVFAFFFICFAFVLGSFFLLLRALGLAPKASKRPSPFAPFGAAFGGRQGQPGQGFDGTAPHEDAVQEDEPASQEETVKQLEEFHGSLDEFLKQRKDSNPS